MRGIEPQELRDSASLRQHVATQLAGVQSVLDGLLAVDWVSARRPPTKAGIAGVVLGEDSTMATADALATAVVRDSSRRLVSTDS